MRPAYYQEKWQLLKDSADHTAIDSLAQRVAASFVDRYFYSDQYNSDYIHLLCEMSTHFEDPSLNQIAARALFGRIIERLCDDFEELQTETYNRLICQVVDYLRKLPEGDALDTELKGFQLDSEEQLYQRIESIRLNPDEPLPACLQPKKVLILSRITIGADVAITSIICQRVAARFPGASIAVAGNAKLSQVIASQSGVRIHELHYARRGGLLQRFLSWVDLLQDVRSEIAHLNSHEYLVLDPDSRLTQLGVLPLVPMRNYRFFNSRGKAGYPAKASISELTNLWLDNIFGVSEFCYPKVWPEPDCVQLASDLRKIIDPTNSRTLITLNFGVGGNNRKLVEGDFEALLVLRLMQDPGNCLLLDMGFGDDERQRSLCVIDAARNHGLLVQELHFSELSKASPESRLLGIECSVAEIAALIATSDEFIGYDSACQHIAAAQNIKTFTVFAGTNNVRFIRRWHACGPNLSEIVYVDTLSKEDQVENSEIIDRLMDLRSD